MKRITRIFIYIALAGLMALPAAPLLAQDNDSEDKYGGRESPASTMTERTYKRLEKLYGMIGEGQYAEATRGLTDLLDSVSDRNEYEQAMVLQALGHTAASQERYPEAIRYWRRAVDLDILPNDVHFGLMYNMANILIATEQYEEGLKALQRWFDTIGEPKPEAYLLQGQAYAHLNRYRDAIGALRTGIELKDKVPDSWYQLLLAMHFELKEYREAAEILETLIVRNPDNREFWKQLSSLYLTMKEDRKALSTLSLAKRRGLMEKESEWVQLFQLYGYLEAPFKAAQVLEEGMKKGVVEGTKKNYEQLGAAWYAAQELEQAAAAYERAARVSADGKLYMRLAYIYTDQESWDKAVTALTNAIEKGVEEPGKAYILLGMAHYETGDLSAANRAFSNAGRYADTSNAARQWQLHIEELRKEGAEQPTEVEATETEVAAATP